MNKAVIATVKLKLLQLNFYPDRKILIISSLGSNLIIFKIPINELRIRRNDKKPETAGASVFRGNPIIS